MAAHVSGQAASGHPSDLSADHLNGAHQRVGEQECPPEAVTELCARLRVGGDSAGIVVGSARDQPWTQNVPQLGPIGLFDLFRRRPERIVRGYPIAPRQSLLAHDGPLSGKSAGYTVHRRMGLSFW